MTIRTTDDFVEWLDGLRDRQGRALIARRVLRLQAGNPGQSRAVGGGVVEMKIDFGPGYRVYYIQRGAELILLLCGGDKSSQQRDIELAKQIAEREK